MTRAERRALTPRQKLDLIRKEQDRRAQREQEAERRAQTVALKRSAKRTARLARPLGELALAEAAEEFLTRLGTKD